mmetsp:Transcript_86698/g.258722  ORF Transcript_86698/g.258722 Transcript_86698/m.258722 type:complete len:204 (+) Transcript_86698:1228-1839(+)
MINVLHDIDLLLQRRGGGLSLLFEDGLDSAECASHLQRALPDDAKGTLAEHCRTEVIEVHDVPGVLYDQLQSTRRLHLHGMRHQQPPAVVPLGPPAVAGGRTGNRRQDSTRVPVTTLSIAVLMGIRHQLEYLGSRHWALLNIVDGNRWDPRHATANVRCQVDLRFKGSKLSRLGSAHGTHLAPCGSLAEQDLRGAARRAGAAP